MNIIGLIYLLVAHYLCGKGALWLFRIKMEPLQIFCFSMMVGVGLLSFVPCFLQLLQIPITAQSVSIGIAAFTVVLSIPLLIKCKRPKFARMVLPAFYEWPFLAIILFLMAVSVWRCFYYPPIARDMLTGPELLAEYTVREGTMINSVFSVDLSSTNNYFKSPYITGLQIMYKLLVCPFGQLWLSVIFISFTLWLYVMVRSMVHPLVAGFLMFFFIAIPDLYAYTYIVLYDYSNMVFFCCGYYFLCRFFESRRMNEFIFSAFLLGIATYIRAETLVLVAMLVPMLVFHYRRLHVRFKQIMYQTGIYLLIPAAFYVLCMYVFIENFIPVPFDVTKNVNSHLGDISVFFGRLWDIQGKLICSLFGLRSYGLFILFFYAVLLADIVWLRRLGKEARMYLYGIVVVMVGLAFLGYLLPLADLGNTTKRGLFKALPLILLYLCHSGFMQRISDLLKRKELESQTANQAK